MTRFLRSPKLYKDKTIVTVQRSRPPITNQESSRGGRGCLIKSWSIIHHHTLIHHTQKHLSHVLVHLRGFGVGIILSIECSGLLGSDIEHIDSVAALHRCRNLALLGGSNSSNEGRIKSLRCERRERNSVLCAYGRAERFGPPYCQARQSSPQPQLPCGQQVSHDKEYP